MASRREHLEIRNEGIIVALELDGVTGGPNYIEVDENQKLKRGCGDPALQDTCKQNHFMRPITIISLLMFLNLQYDSKLTALMGSTNV